MQPEVRDQDSEVAPLCARAAPNNREPITDNRSSTGFTLIELLIVISIIIILLGLLFPAFRGVQDQAKKTQAKNDLTQIVTAVNAFYTEYGRYPLDQTAGTVDVLLTNNVSVMDVLRYDTTRSASTVTSLNSRGIQFITPPYVKTPANPLSGIATQATSVNTVTVSAGDYVDPWGTPYVVAIDGDYSGFVRVGTALKYSDLTYTKDPPASGPDALQLGIAAASYGKDQTLGTKGPPASSSFKSSDDVISWQ